MLKQYNGAVFAYLTRTPERFFPVVGEVLDLLKVSFQAYVFQQSIATFSRASTYRFTANTLPQSLYAASKFLITIVLIRLSVTRD